MTLTPDRSKQMTALSFSKCNMSPAAKPCWKTCSLCMYFSPAAEWPCHWSYSAFLHSCCRYNRKGVHRHLRHRDWQSSVRSRSRNCPLLSGTWRSSPAHVCPCSSLFWNQFSVYTMKARIHRQRGTGGLSGRGDNNKKAHRLVRCSFWMVRAKNIWQTLMWFKTHFYSTATLEKFK